MVLVHKVLFVYTLFLGDIVNELFGKFIGMSLSDPVECLMSYKNAILYEHIDLEIS